MRLSVIVMTYNQEESVGRALDSILGQDIDFDYEILVGDDASTDRTPEIVSEYARRHPGIIKPVFRGKNLGITGNFLDLLGRASGDIIAGCAGDDFWLPGRLTTQLALMDSRPDIGLSYSFARVVDPQGNTIGSYTDITCIDATALLRGNPVPAPTLIYRRKLALRYVAEVNPASRHWVSEDWPMLLWFAANSTIGCTPVETVAYTISPLSATHSRDSLRRCRFVESDCRMRLYFINRYFPAETALRRALELDSLTFGGFRRVLTGESPRAELAAAKRYRRTARRRIMHMIMSTRSRRIVDTFIYRTYIRPDRAPGRTVIYPAATPSSSPRRYGRIAR